MRKEIRKEILGPAIKSFPVLFEGSDKAIGYLDDPDPKKRRAAVYFGDKYYGLDDDPGFLERCRELANADPDTGVRMAAVCALVRKYSGTADQRVSHLLAEIIASSQNLAIFQQWTYHGLREVHFGPSSHLEGERRSLSIHRVDQSAAWTQQCRDIMIKIGYVTQKQLEEPGRIDWEFVRLFLPAAAKPECDEDNQNGDGSAGAAP